MAGVRGQLGGESPRAARPAVARPPRPGRPSRWQRAPGDASPSFSSDYERRILRVLAVLNAELERPEPGYETRARLYFYLSFQRYHMLRWLGWLSVRDHGRASERRGRITAILQCLISPRILEPMDEQLYRDMVVALSGHLFALLRLARNQVSGGGLATADDGDPGDRRTVGESGNVCVLHPPAEAAPRHKC